jgi:hypothetical protein
MSGSHAGSASTRPAVQSARHLSIEYLGFRNGRERREYLFCARWGAESAEYTIWIAGAAFSGGHALFQDGPDICFQKLRRELEKAEPTSDHTIEVTRSELLEYRVAHAPPQRRTQFSNQGRG